MTACELAYLKIPFRIIEAKERREHFCKAVGLSPRTLEVLDQRGLLDEARRRGLIFNALKTEVAGRVVEDLPSRHPLLPYWPLSLEQPETEAILEERLNQWGRSVERGLALTGLSQERDSVVAELSDGSLCSPRWVVGCDGAHSAVRKALGLPFEGERYPLTFVLGDVVLGWDRPHGDTWKIVALEDGEVRNVLAAIPLAGAKGRYRISLSAPPDWDPVDRPSLELLTELARPMLPDGTTLSELRWSSTYHISHRIVPRYSQGRVFLAGDAAHIHPPIGGLGMNTGLQDAFNLAWKLAAVIQGRAGEALLETYSAERQPIGAQVVRVTSARMDRAIEGGEPEPEPPYFDTQLFLSYPEGPLVRGSGPEGAPQPGERLPCVDGLVRPGAFGEMRALELLKPGKVQLFAPDRDRLASLLAAVPTPWRDAVHGWEVRGEASPGDDGSTLWDSRGQWRKLVGPGPVLVRPDGHIGWRGEDPSELARWFPTVDAQGSHRP